MDVNCRWIYCAPFHKNIKENITDSKFRSYDFLHLKSRSKLCTNPDAKVLFKQNYDIRGICESCPDRHACEYELNLKKAHSDRPNLAITHAHLQTWLPNFLNRKVDGELIGDDYDVLIIDENPIKTFMNVEEVHRSELFNIYSIARQAKCDDDLIKFIELIMEKTIDYDELEDTVLPQKRLTYNIKRFGDKAFELWKIGALRKVPKNIINQIYKVSSYIGIKNIEKMVQGRKYTVKLSFFNPEIISQLNIKKIIALDGTATKEVWEKMLGSTPDMMVAGVQYDHAYQLKDARYPISSWIGYGKASGYNPTPDRLCKMIDKIAARKKRNTLVICTKKIQKIIEGKCKIRRVKRDKVLGAYKVEFANYYALRGLNDYYERCDTVILAHEPNPPQIEMDTYTELSGWTEKIWRTVYREEEMQQAIGRIRENLKVWMEGKKRETVEVFIFPNTGVDKFSYTSTLLEDAEVMSYNELDRLLGSTTGYKLMRNSEKKILENLPNSVSGLMRVTGLSRTRVKKYLNHLIKKEYVKLDGKKYKDTKKSRASPHRRSKFWIKY